MRFAWLRMPALAALLARLDDDGEEARVVGGAVRNALLDEDVHEWDIATTALPETVMARARAAGWKVVPTGIAHGTVTVVVEGHPFEVTTLREDVETDGRHAVVRFGRDFRADAFRRDFTINALSLSRDGVLHDYTGGLEDIAARRVRFIGDADRRIAEDYLRILRLFRFHARYGSGPIDPEGFTAAIRARDGLRRLSAERIRAELLKLMPAARAGDVLAEIDGAGFLLIVLGGIARVPSFRRLVGLEAAFGIPPDPVRRLAVLSLFTRADAARLSALLRLSNAEARRFAGMALLVESLRRPPDPARAREYLYRLGRADFEDGVLAAYAHAPDQDFGPCLTLAASWTIPRNPFGGGDVAGLGIEAGPRVGRILACAERRWIDLGFPSDGAIRRTILAEAAAVTE
ncbi:CCA tRNA nucleotidyltransferase [Labrys monachus]|uniref:Poly(A) polymerase n=1 Tax=Labrys monachus TaxID=217067 RepID=A0ABU0FJC0_9HYPH|nr:CCA tRNA nucleotidyltransferase [Labrys monachus]MDQ0394703.1 poly(A) polymerase [Labrys monachus]